MNLVLFYLSWIYSQTISISEIVAIFLSTVAIFLSNIRAVAIMPASK
ncbi:MAG: hypothetical protein ACXAAT_06235 [Candidatus Hodarchaeales archaeon]